jgi:Zn-dependent membrane protease YugP
VLNAAAMTYVWAAIASLVSFLRLLALANRTRR